MSELINCPKINCPKYFCPKFFGVNVYTSSHRVRRINERLPLSVNRALGSSHWCLSKYLILFSLKSNVHLAKTPNIVKSLESESKVNVLYENIEW